MSSKESTKKKLLEILNQSISREIAVSIQYMWNHVMATGMNAEDIGGVFEDVAKAEMKHAEKFAERIWYLGGEPTTKPTEIKVVKDGNIKKMLEDGVTAEKEAIALYRSAVKVAMEADDPVSRLLYEEILGDEEGHDDKFTTLLGR